MNSMKYIRKQLFQATQQDFAAIAGVQQSTVSRWERGAPPTLEEMQRIREAAKTLKIKWDDRLFFEAPKHGAAA